MGKNETIYLGTQISTRVNPKIEINRRISSTMPILKRLDLFWKQARVPTKWKNQAFTAVFPNSCTAWKHCNQQKPRQVNWILFRKTLKMSTTYIDRANTNHEVYRRANLEMGLGAEEIIRPLSDVLQEKRRKVLGHIIRRRRDHPQHQATFATRNLLPQQVEHRRVGRPRAVWTYETMKDFRRRTFYNIPFQIQNREHREQIETWALNREDPF